MSRETMKNMKVIEEDGNFNVSFTVTQIDCKRLLEGYNFKDRLETEICNELAKKVTVEVFNDVMKKIDVSSIATATSVQVIQNLASPKDKDRY